MKDYKRLTPNSYTETIGIAQQDKVFNQAVITQAWDWENKIESGELCDREEDRKETAREILKSMLNKMYKLTGCGVPYHVKKFIEEIAMEYGVELFGNSNKLKDEE